jgi:dTDP-4-dehydrorhamnose 3,5-epimerase
MIEGVIIKKLNKYDDERGWLSEIWREDELKNYKPAMAYVSETKPGVVRGPHEHEAQSDCFIFIGPGDFELHLWDHLGEYVKIIAGASEPTLVIVPPGVVHGYKNISDVNALSINLPNALYKGTGKTEDVDEIRWELDENSPYKIL